MNKNCCLSLRYTLFAALALCVGTRALADPPTLKQEPNTWVKRSPLISAPTSPGMGYETSLGYDRTHQRVIRWGGHNQGGGGEQNAETWTLDPGTLKWELKQPNRSPPGVCCAQQNVFDLAAGRFLRFPAFSGQHGWHWFRENYLTNTSVWSYDLAANRWRDLCPLPAPHPAPLRCASWDSHHQVAVVFGGEGSNDGTLVYDPHLNAWKRMRPKIEPRSRSGGNLAYDAAHRLHILFGTQFGDDPHTWAYDLAKNQWRDLKPAVQPPTDRNDAVLAYDPVGKVVVAVVRAVDQANGMEITRGHLETWAFDAGKNTWTAMKPVREPDGWGNRRRVLVAIPDQNVLLMEAYANPTERIPGVDREQQIWTYRYTDTAGAQDANPIQPMARTQPRIVEDVVATVVSPREVRLRWKAPAGRAVNGYHVERAVVEMFGEDEVVRLKKDTPSLPEPSVGAIRAIGDFDRLTKQPVAETAYTDRNIDLTTPQTIKGEPIFRHRFRADQLDANGKPYRFGVHAYRIRAVNAQGAESGPSPYILTIPAAPESLFAREDGATCHLKWTHEAHGNLKGYRIYRMEGPRINGPGQKVTRLNADVITELRWTDTAATKDTRRYWVVAVDALGQEGYPSAPAWHYRQYRKYYEPFVGEWHQ
jgi:hypothetical protein